MSLFSLLLLFFAALPPAGLASSHFTEKQLETLAQRVGRTYWVVQQENRSPLFLSAPSPSAPLFPVPAKESFKITELVRGRNQGPYYYKLLFPPAKEGYISVDSFIEELNAAIVTQDPDRWQKAKAAREAQEEEKRESSIRAQPWPEHIKEAALKRKAVLGMDKNAAKAALGKPVRVVKLQTGIRQLGDREQWSYEGGVTLTFTNGVITQMDSGETRAE